MVLRGPAGIGKTTLAHQVLAMLPPFAGGIVVADLGGSAQDPPPTLEILAALLREAGWHGPWRDLEVATGWWRTVTAHRPVAVLLDDAATAEQVRDLLPGEGSVALVTSRATLAELTVLGADHDVVGPLPPAEAEQMLALGAGPEAAVDRARAADVLKACLGNPLLINLAAARLLAAAEVPSCRAADRLPIPAAENWLTSHLHESYRALSLPAAAAYRAMGTVPFTRVSSHALAAVLQTDAADAAVCLAELERSGLVAPTGHGHALVPAGHGRRAAASLAEHIDAPELLQAQRRRSLEWWLITLARAGALLAPQHKVFPCPVRFQVARAPLFDTPGEAWAWLTGQEDQVRPALTGAVAHEWDLTWRAVHALAPLWQHQRPHALWQWACEVGVESARSTGGAALRELLVQHAAVLSSCGRHTDALLLLTEAVDLARADQDGPGMARHLLAVCAAMLDHGRPFPGALPTPNQAAAAQGHVDEAGLLLGETRQPHAAASAAILRAQIYAALGRQHRALAVLRNACRDIEKLNDVELLAQALMWHAIIQLDHGHHEAAARQLHHAQSLFAAAGATRMEAVCLEQRAAAAHHAGAEPRHVAGLLREAAEAYGGGTRDALRIRHRLNLLATHSPATTPAGATGPQTPAQHEPSAAALTASGWR